MTNISRRDALFSLSAISLGLASNVSQAKAGKLHRIAVGETAFELDGKPFMFKSGEIHPHRVPRPYWRHRLKMLRALGLNTVCIYVFWNNHEWHQGQFDWNDERDIAEFVRIAHEEGLWVILRAGPYVCGEWDLGGLPWWLLNTPDIKLRSRDPKFLGPAERWMREVGRRLSPLTIGRGGPILMVQVENEYGSFGNDALYMGEIERMIIESGFDDVLLYACNPRIYIGNGYRPELYQVANFGPGIWPKGIPALRDYQKTGPLMIGEYYPGWIDAWGKGHRTGDVEPFIRDLDKFLREGISFNIYMAHGGTNFGLLAGGGSPFEPFTTSYDYDAPVSEAGWQGSKFQPLRALLAAHADGGKAIPEPPASNPVIAIERLEMVQRASLWDNLPEAKLDTHMRYMERYGQGAGNILYRCTLKPGPAAVLSIADIRDFGWLFIDHEPIGPVCDPRQRKTPEVPYRFDLPARSRAVQVDLYVEAMGRPNFIKAGELYNKGATGPITLLEGETTRELLDWQIYNFDFGETEMAQLQFGPVTNPVGPSYYRAAFTLNRIGDTFLDMRGWGKGLVWINGHNLGRYWNIGPQQTLYCPLPFLRKGKNEIVVLELLNKNPGHICGLSQPILDELHPELDLAKLALPPTDVTY